MINSLLKLLCRMAPKVALLVGDEVTCATFSKKSESASRRLAIASCRSEVNLLEDLNNAWKSYVKASFNSSAPDQTYRVLEAEKHARLCGVDDEKVGDVRKIYVEHFVEKGVSQSPMAEMLEADGLNDLEGLKKVRKFVSKLVLNEIVDRHDEREKEGPKKDRVVKDGGKDGETDMEVLQQRVANELSQQFYAKIRPQVASNSQVRAFLKHEGVAQAAERLKAARDEFEGNPKRAKEQRFDLDETLWECVRDATASCLQTVRKLPPPE